MSLLAVETRMGALSTYTLPGGTYDQDKLGLCGAGVSSLFQFTGATDDDKWAGPFPQKVIRTYDLSAVANNFISAVSESANVDWIFTVGLIAAATTSRVNLYTFNRSTLASTYQGYLTVSFPDTGVPNTYTVKGFKASLEKYTTGTASVAAAVVTGTATTWQTDRICVGCRIGFGSTDPSAIVTWYEIQSVDAEGQITLTAAAGVIADGPYVIEDLRLFYAVTDSTTTTNGGLMMCKGLKYELFTGAGAAFNTFPNGDNLRGVYHLREAAGAGNTNTVATGLGLGPRDTWVQQYVYVMDFTGTAMYKYNVRSATINAAAGKDDVHAFVLKTGAQAFTGTVSIYNCMTNVVTPAHGAGSGDPSLYFVTSTRLYRVSVAAVTGASITWHTANPMVQSAALMPGTNTTFADMTPLVNVTYLPGCDRFLCLNSNSGTSQKALFTAYNEDGVSEWDRIIFGNDEHIDQSTMSTAMVPHMPGDPNFIMHGCQLNGIVYIQHAGTASATGTMWVTGLDGDWEGAYLILPRIQTPGCTSFGKVYAHVHHTIGQAAGPVFDLGVTAHNFGIPTEPFKIWYRISGIDTNLGAWSGPVNSLGDISAVTATSQIQFKVGFRTAGMTTSMPTRLLGVGATYNDGIGVSNYQPSATFSDAATKKFAWRFCTAFGGAVPTLYVRIYNAVTMALTNSDNTAAPTGLWEKSTDGGSSWVGIDNVDKANDITYIRWTPAIMADNFIAKAVLSLS